MENFNAFGIPLLGPFDISRYGELMKPRGMIRILTLAITLFPALSFSQGQVAFANNPSGPIIYNDGTLAGSEITVGFYYSDDLSASEDEMILGGITPVLQNGLFNYGPGEPLTIPLSIGTIILIDIRAWSGPFGTFEDALDSGNPDYWAGSSGILSPYLVAGGTSPVPSLPTNAGLGTIILTPIPEPNTSILFAFIGLLLFSVMRKQVVFNG